MEVIRRGSLASMGLQLHELDLVSTRTEASEQENHETESLADRKAHCGVHLRDTSLP